ncbi:polysaccharide pyruvyl transferase family protein [Paraburkholderia sp. GAS348]|uniref:polysaccharide pyruvyl transferase family protein n=1 Tax=Paraburkholderia sp. GAS348 TaxID=3035132 RepID=UPI003D1F619D
MNQIITSPSRHIKIVALGYYGAPNVGDELLLTVLARWVKERDGELVALSINPEYTRQHHGIDAVEFFNLGDIGRALSDADLLVFGGGGIFQDHHPFHVEALYDPTQNDIAAYARIFYMARQFGVRTAIWAHGVGPLTNPAAREIVKDIFTLVDHASLRDSDSLALLQSIGVQRDIPVGADPGWAFVAMPQPDIPSAAELAPLTGKKKLAVIVRPWEFNRGWEEKLIAALRQTLDASWSIVWIGFQWSEGTRESATDRCFVEELQRATADVVQSVIVDRLEPEQAFAIVKECDAVFSMRLHGSILAIGGSIPVAALEYDNKMSLAHDMAGLPATMRLQLTDDEARFASVLRSLTGTDGTAWTIAQAKLNTLAASTRVHAAILDDAFATARARATAPGRWHSDQFDWMSAWLQQAIWQRDGSQRINQKAHDLLHYRDVQLAESAAHVARLDGELAESAAHVARLDGELTQASNELARAADRLVTLEESVKRLEQARIELEQQAERERAEHTAARDAERERHAQQEQAFRQIIADHPRLFALFNVRQPGTLDEAPIKTQPSLHTVMLFRRYLSAPRAYMSRAAYILRNGGVRALVSAARRHYHVQQAMHATPALPAATDANGHTDERHLWFQAAARLQRAELIIIAPHRYDWGGAGHRYAQLATTALGAGHRVIYLDASHTGSSALPVTGVPGLIHESIDSATVEGVFGHASEFAKLIIGVPDSRALPFFEYAKNRGVETIFDVAYDWSRTRAPGHVPFGTFVSEADRCTVATPALAGIIDTAAHAVVEKLPGAAAHSIFDAYKKYEGPTGFDEKKRRIALFYSVNGLASLDWALLKRIAEQNLEVMFYLIADGQLPADLPANIVLLGSRHVTEVPAYIAYADFLYFPLVPEALLDSDSMTGVYAGLHQRKHVVSSLNFGLPVSSGLHVCEDAQSFADQCTALARSDATTFVDDSFIANNSWLGRLEQLCPPVPRHDVSVVILIHNNARIIARCLETLLTHCAPYMSEVVVVDNASSDGGAEIVESQFPQVKLVRNPQNGCSSGRNLGVQHSKGKYIAFFDSDQWFVGSSGFAEALHVLEHDASIGVIGWNAGWFDATRTDLGGMIADYCPNRAMNAAAIRDGYRADIGFLGTSGFFMRRCTFEATHGFDTFYDPTCFEDTDLCFQIKALRMKVTYRDLSGIRHQPHQTTGANTGSEAYQALFLRNANYFKEKWRDYSQFYLDYTS